MSSTSFNPEKEIRNLLEEVKEGPFRAMIAAQTLSGQFHFWIGLRLLRLEWNQGSLFNEREEHTASSNRKDHQAVKKLTYSIRKIRKCFMFGHLPVQTTNEFRNALTHLSRAAASKDENTLEKELNNAHRHLERATRDSWKIAIISVRDSIIKRTDLLEAKSYTFSNSIYKKISFTEAERRNILIDEHISSAGSDKYKDITSRYENLTRVLTELEDTIIKNYKISIVDRLFWKRPLWFRSTVTIAAFLLVTLLAFLLTTKYACYVSKNVDNVFSHFSTYSIRSEKCKDRNHS